MKVGGPTGRSYESSNSVKNWRKYDGKCKYYTKILIVAHTAASFSRYIAIGGVNKGRGPDSNIIQFGLEDMIVIVNIIQKY
jgi:hypothetical protein